MLFIVDAGLQPDSELAAPRPFSPIEVNMQLVPTHRPTTAATGMRAAASCCPLCGAEAVRRFDADAFDAAPGSKVSISECMNCTLAWQFPFGRSTEESASYFADAYQDGGSSRSDYFEVEHRRKVAAIEIDFLDTLSARGKTLLDLGAGSGTFAQAAAERGWRVTAIDPAISPERLAHAHVRAIRGSLEQLPAADTFDVITMWDVVEHLEHPDQVLHDAVQHLRPGGWLILETGNYKSADRILGGRGHWIYQLDHRWYFSPDSLQTLLERLGLGNFKFAQRVLRPHWQGASGYQGPTLQQLLKSILKTPSKTRQAWDTHRRLQDARHWPQAGLPIFCVAAQRPAP